MPKWNLVSYNNKEIKTEEDILWICKEVKKAYESGHPEMKDIMALSFLKDLHQKHIDQGCFGFIESRFEILDL